MLGRDLFFSRSAHDMSTRHRLTIEDLARVRPVNGDGAKLSVLDVRAAMKARALAKLDRTPELPPGFDLEDVPS